MSANPLISWRLRLGLTQTEAAALIGMTLRGYGDLERGTRHAAGVPLMHRLAAAAVEAKLAPIE